MNLFEFCDIDYIYPCSPVEAVVKSLLFLGFTSRLSTFVINCLISNFKLVFETCILTSGHLGATARRLIV